LFDIVDDPFWKCEHNVVALKSIIERKMSFGIEFAIINHFGSNFSNCSLVFGFTFCK
jgi:hypothetical protein